MTISERLSRIANKIKKANHGKMKELSTGEKILKVVLILIKISIVATIVVLFGVIILAVVTAVGIMNAFTSSVNEQIDRSWRYHHRNNW